MYPKGLSDAPRVGGGGWRARLCVWLERLLCPVGTSPSMSAISMSVLSCVYLMAKASSGNAVHGGFAGCACKFRSCFLASLMPMVTEVLSRGVCTPALKLLLHPAPQDCHILLPVVRWLFLEML